jgi:hypothetical protein
VGGSAASGATHVTVSIRARRAADVESVRQLPNLKGCYKKSAHYDGASRAIRFVWHVTVSPRGAATATGQALDGFLVDMGDHRQGWEYPPDAQTSDEGVVKCAEEALKAVEFSGASRGTTFDAEVDLSP